MFRDVSACNTYNYSDALYWDSRYIHDANYGSFDWYQWYSALRPFVRKYISPTSRVLMVGCGNAVISEDMVNDGFEDIMNIDISSVAIDMMRKKYENVPQLKYMQMDVKDMSFFPDESFDSVIDKGTLDSLMCGTSAPINAAQMLGEVCRLLKPGGVYMLITYGDPTVRMPHINRPVYSWKIELYIILLKPCNRAWYLNFTMHQPTTIFLHLQRGKPSSPTLKAQQVRELPIFCTKFYKKAKSARPGFQKPPGSTSLKSYLEPVPLTEKGLLPADYTMEDPYSHFIYVCKKADDPTDVTHRSTNSLPDDTLRREMTHRPLVKYVHFTLTTTEVRLAKLVMKRPLHVLAPILMIISALIIGLKVI